MIASLIEKLEESAVDGSKAVNGWKYVLLASVRDIVRQHEAEQPKASAQMVKLIAECRDALQAALPHIEGSSYMSLYVRRQVKEQSERCEAATAALQAAPVAEAATARIYGIPLVVSELVPPNEVHFLQDGRIVGKTVDIGTAASDGWIDWHGGECPVPPDAVVNVVYRDSPEVIEGPILASEASELWGGQNDGDDIIRYRVVRQGDAP